MFRIQNFLYRVKMSNNLKQFAEIKDLTQILEKSLKRKVLDYSLKYLTKPGELTRDIDSKQLYNNIFLFQNNESLRSIIFLGDNYGSIMQSVNVVVVRKNDLNDVNLNSLKYL